MEILLIPSDSADLRLMQTVILFGHLAKKELPSRQCEGKLKKAMDLSIKLLLRVRDILAKPGVCTRVGAFRVCHREGRRVRWTRVGVTRLGLMCKAGAGAGPWTGRR